MISKFTRLFGKYWHELSPTAAHLKDGVAAEKSALKFLRSKGLKLLAQNYRCTYGEIDIIMCDDKQLVFIEVRYRKNQNFGGAISSVDVRKQRKIKMASEDFLRRNNKLHFGGYRFDVCALSGETPNFKIDWLRDAF